MKYKDGKVIFANGETRTVINYFVEPTEYRIVKGVMTIPNQQVVLLVRDDNYDISEIPIKQININAESNEILDVIF